MKALAKRRGRKGTTLAYEAKRSAYINAEGPDPVTADAIRDEVERCLAEHAGYEDDCGKSLSPPEVILVRYETDLDDGTEGVEVLPGLLGRFSGKHDAFGGDGSGDPLWLWDVAVPISDARAWLARFEAEPAGEAVPSPPPSGARLAEPTTPTASYDAEAAPEDGPSPTREQYERFVSLYAYFNEKLGLALGPAMLAFSRKANSVGYFAPERWRKTAQDADALNEIALNPDHISRDPRAVASTIVHEMVHAWQHEHGQKKPRRGYHNAEWGEKMESIGFMPSPTGLPGGKKVGARMTHYIVEGGPFATAYAELPEGALLPFTSGLPATLASTAKKKRKDPSKTPFVCSGSCGSKMWGKPSLLVTCKDCGVDFVPVDGAANSNDQEDGDVG